LKYFECPAWSQTLTQANRFGDFSAFVVAVKAGSFIAAATALGLTRSAVGKSVVCL
jgi:hypothetical protein